MDRNGQRGEANGQGSDRKPVEAVGELLYRFEADLEMIPVGLTPEGIRIMVGYEGEISVGMLEGARAWGIDPLLLRADGVGVVDTAKTISDGETTLYEHMHAYCIPPQGLELPPPEAILDPSFEWPDAEFPILGFSTFRSGHPGYGDLNTTIAAIEGWANFATERNAIEARMLRHTGTAAAPQPRRDSGITRS
jgi:hypothetical protein